MKKHFNKISRQVVKTNYIILKIYLTNPSYPHCLFPTASFCFCLQHENGTEYVFVLNMFADLIYQFIILPPHASRDPIALEEQLK